MSNIKYKGTSQTIQTAIISGLILASISPHDIESLDKIDTKIHYTSLNRLSNNARYDYLPLSGIKNSQNPSIHNASNHFISEISEFYSSLTTKQERLGEEFEKILFKNLWDLYD